VAIDQQRVVNVLAYDSLLCVFGDVGDLADDEDAFSLRALTGFIDPKVVVAVTERIVVFFLFLDLCFYLLKPLREGTKVIRVVIRLRHKVKVVQPKLDLHILNILSKPVLAREFDRVHEVVDLLVVVQLLVNLRFLLQRHGRPQEVPIVHVCLLEVLTGKDGLENLGFGVDELEVGLLGLSLPGYVDSYGVLRTLDHAQHARLVPGGLKQLHLLVELRNVLQPLDRELPVVSEHGLDALIDHVGVRFAEVLVAFKDFVKPQQLVDFVLFAEEILLKRFYVGLKHFTITFCDFSSAI